MGRTGEPLHSREGTFSPIDAMPPSAFSPDRQKRRSIDRESEGGDAFEDESEDESEDVCMRVYV